MSKLISAVRKFLLIFVILVGCCLLSPSAQAAQILFEAEGPLPKSTTIPFPGNEQTWLFSGSAYTRTSLTDIGVDVLVNGNVVGTPTIYSTANNTHRSLVNNIIKFDLTCSFADGGCADITITLQNSPTYSNTLTDGGDHFQLVQF